MKALCSFSGGLDSILASKLVMDQGIEVEALYFKTGFGGCGDSEDASSVKERASRLGMDFSVIDVGAELLEIIKSPRHGFGRNMNPCVDCHSLFFKKCGELMERKRASFIITGEVLGERPMSQRKDALRQVDKETGLKGLILRPLSAKLLEVTIPEEKGWIDRERLMAISGRSRKPQIAMAKKYGFEDYPNPAGGCLLTQSDFSRRLKDIMSRKEDIGPDDVLKLRIGRHFRLSDTAKFVIGRDEKENQKLILGMSEEDICLMTVDIPGPVGILSGSWFEKDELTAAAIISAYSDAAPGEDMIIVRKTTRQKDEKEFKVASSPKEYANEFLI